ncbi:hypothetical protein C8F04DRAFT_1193591 [Mycena alexandri]|uniref:Uncharacterized protein n=1 Tax=Mycena alexandri TaxID=1745969 RepID=A0AAD6S9E9_9AGAR|nr:hypothetical protein C8F04DRAFT_1193591 [Mycena alexandri]
MDTNFRLKNRMRKNERNDPTFGPGWGYMVAEKRYKKHLRSYVAEKDVSSCIAFAALLQKDTRMTTSLRVSGVGAVVCARHEVVRPQGVGDLQKGERYSNIDYIFLSAILGIMATYLVVSYDIACQWQVNLRSRIGNMPKGLQPPAELEMQFVLPVWHASAHESKWATKNSLSYMPGVGKTDGEGIKRTWSELNPAAWATKEMGNGARHDALEDRIDHHNWERNIGQGDTLARKLVVAIEERDRQVEAFAEVDKTLKPDLKKDWQQQINAWLADRTLPSPYEAEGGKKSGPSEAAVRRELKKDELRDGREGVYRKGHTVFLAAGMQLEQIQYTIKLELKGKTLLSGDLIGRVEELRLSFLAKLKTFRNLQERHMPGAIRREEEEEEERDADEPAPNPEDIKLWMPSELTGSEREDECAEGLGDREAKLRLAQCTNVLDTLRLRLHSKQHLISFRNSHVVGQKHATRWSTLIGMLEGAVLYCEEHGLRALTDADVRLDEEWESDGKAWHRLAKIGGSKHRHTNEPTVSSKKKMFSWIWTSGDGPESDAEGLHEGQSFSAKNLYPVNDFVWVAAKARRDRWVEEVQFAEGGDEAGDAVFCSGKPPGGKGNARRVGQRSSLRWRLGWRCGLGGVAIGGCMAGGVGGFEDISGGLAGRGHGQLFGGGAPSQEEGEESEDEGEERGSEGNWMSPEPQAYALDA